MHALGFSAAQSFESALGGTTLQPVDNSGTLVAHWAVDDPAGTTVASGNSGTQVDLVLGSGSASPAFTPGDGAFGGSLSFDGVDDLASITDNRFDIGAAGTLSFWVRLDDAALPAPLVSGPGGDGLDFGYQPQDGGAFYGSPYSVDDAPRVVFSIYDTGASVVTVSANDQTLFELAGGTPIPIKVVSGAEADAIGGVLVGDVSVPGTVIADGLHAVNFGDELEFQIDVSEAALARNVQAFVGTTDGSPALPSIVGVPIHSPSPTHPNGVAALIGMAAFEMDFGALFPEIPEFEDIKINLPDIRFIEPQTVLEVSPETNVSTPVRVPLDLFGTDNHLDPGELITATHNPVVPDVRAIWTDAQDVVHEVGGKSLLFDTGAQLSILDVDFALALGLDLDAPETSITVQGAGGQAEIPGFTIDGLRLPRDEDRDGVADEDLYFSGVPIYVLDMVEGLDGIIGMNLFNSAETLLYDPFDSAGPSLQLRFFNDFQHELPDELTEAAIDMLAQTYPAFGGIGGRNAPSFGAGGEVSVPGTRVVGRHLIYDDSYYDLFSDDEAIAPKSALLPGRTASFQNYSSYSSGINAIAVDILNAADPQSITADDFAFRVGNSSDTSSWIPAPTPFHSEIGSGTLDLTRVYLYWDNNAIENEWLEVVVLPTENTGLTSPDVFYFGNAIGETGDSTLHTHINAFDLAGNRDNANPDAYLANRFDHDRDGIVDGTDYAIVRDHARNFVDALQLIKPPLPPPTLDLVLIDKRPRPAVPQTAIADVATRVTKSRDDRPTKPPRPALDSDVRGAIPQRNPSTALLLDLIIASEWGE